MWIFYISVLILCTQCVPSTSKGNQDSDSVGQTCKSGLPALTPEQIPGKCTTFNGSSCYCNLNNNCKYDMQTGHCYNVTDCSRYNGQATLCKYFHCYYDCSTGVCSLQEDSAVGCLLGKDTCFQYCNDVCLCMASGCHYNSEGRCKKRDCAVHLKGDKRCRRPNTFYSEGGNICRNDVIQGDCVIEQVFFAVNMGGGAYTDCNGVLYQDDSTAMKYDPDGIGASYKLDIKELDAFPDKNIYENLIVAQPAKRKSDSCIVYMLPLCKNGEYELIIKAIEIADVIPGEKSFNIKLGEKYAFREIDIVREVGARFIPVDLVVLFRIENGILIIDGHSPQSLKPGGMPLSFCFGDCMFMEGGFQIAGFHVAKLLNSREVASRQDCNLFSGLPWECKGAGCQYNSSIDKCNTLVAECQKPAETKCKKICDPVNLEMMFLLDSSGSGNQHSTDSESIVFQHFPRIAKVATTLKQTFPKSKYGITFFSDFSCADWNICGDMFPSGKSTHDDPEGCYRRHLPLSENLQVFEKASQRDQLTERFSVLNEPGLFATFLAAADTNVNWTRGNPADVVKVIVVVTDDGHHLLDPQGNRKMAAKADGTDSCQKSRVPPIARMEEIFLREGISFFLLHNFARDKNSYYGALKLMKMPYASGLLTEETPNIASQLQNFTQIEIDKRCKEIY